MTTEELKDMFLAQEAWDRQEQDKDVLVRLAESLAALGREVAKLNEILKQD